MSEVPPDLIAEVLLYLSVDKVLRFRCISKSLCDIIDGPKFIKSHLLRRGTHRKIVIRPRPAPPIHVFDMEGPFLPDFDRNRFNDSYFAHCDGLIVLEEGGLFLWNPSIRKFRKLPVLPNKEEEAKDLQDKGMCLGYDSSIDDYKVMVIKETKRSNDANYKPEYRIWVLGLRSSSWRRIELPCDCYLSDFNNCFVDGAFYFRCSDGAILAFDLAKETFCNVPIPYFFKGYPEYYRTSLVVLEGCLCVRLFSCEKQVELYARKKNAVVEFSWTKLFSIESRKPPPYLKLSSEVLGFSKDRDKIFLLFHQACVYSYDLKEKNFTLTLARDMRSEKVYSCIESLVWIDEEENERKRKRSSAKYMN